MDILQRHCFYRDPCREKWGLYNPVKRACTYLIIGRNGLDVQILSENYEYHGPTDNVVNHFISGNHSEFNTHFICISYRLYA